MSALLLDRAIDFANLSRLPDSPPAVASCPEILGQHYCVGAGNATERLANCTVFRSPPKRYLDVTFLGKRRFVVADSVNFTYFQFGPLNRGTAGM